MEVGNVDAHSLFTHSALVRVTRRLIVIGERNNRRTDSQDHGGMNLAVSVRRTVRVFTLSNTESIVRRYVDTTAGSANCGISVLQYY